MTESCKGRTLAIGLAATATVVGLTATAISIPHSHTRQPSSSSSTALPRSSERKHPNSENPLPSYLTPSASHSSPRTSPTEKNSPRVLTSGPRERNTISTSEQAKTQPKPVEPRTTRFPSGVYSSIPLPSVAVSTEPHDCINLTQPQHAQSKIKLAHSRGTASISSSFDFSEPFPNLVISPPKPRNSPQHGSQFPDTSSPHHWNVFWDLENVQVPRGVLGHFLIQNLRERLSDLYPVPILRIIAVCNILRLTVNLRNQLQASGVTLVHVETRGRKDAADKALISDMCLLATEHAPPAGIVLISGDSDFAYALARLRNFGYFTVVVANGTGASCAELLKQVPNVFWGLRKHVLPANRRERRSKGSAPMSQKKGGGKKGTVEWKASETQSFEGLLKTFESSFEAYGETQEESCSAEEIIDTCEKQGEKVRVEHGKQEYSGTDEENSETFKKHGQKVSFEHKGQENIHSAEGNLDVFMKAGHRVRVADREQEERHLGEGKSKTWRKRERRVRDENRGQEDRDSVEENFETCKKFGQRVGVENKGGKGSDSAVINLSVFKKGELRVNDEDERLEDSRSAEGNFETYNKRGQRARTEDGERDEGLCVDGNSKTFAKGALMERVEDKAPVQRGSRSKQYVASNDTTKAEEVNVERADEYQEMGQSRIHIPLQVTVSLLLIGLFLMPILLLAKLIFNLLAHISQR